MTNNQPSSARLLPQLGLFSSIAIIMGTMIGSGIFKKAGPMAALLGSPELLILVWVIAGLVTLCGALTNAEIAGMIPDTGGQYKYFQAMYGKGFAFLYGWAIFAVIQTGSIASIAYIFAEYLNSVFPLATLPPSIVSAFSFQLPLIGKIALLDNIGVKALTISVICLLSLINYRGTRFGGWTAGVFTTLKVAVMLAIIAVAFSYSGGSAGNFSASTLPVPVGNALFLAIIAAMSKAFWAYDGWNSIGYIAGEIHSPQRTIPRALLFGVSGVIVLYILINLAYLYVLPIETMAASKLVAADMMTTVLGNAGASLVAVAVMISTFGATNNTVLNSARVYYAMAKDGLFFSSLGRVSPYFSTPSVALAVQCLWSCLLVLSGTFETLTDMLIFVSWIFYGMSAVGVFILRRSMPDTARPYRVWGYPVIPAVFIAVATLFVFFTLYNDLLQYAANSANGIPSLTGLFITLAGLPLYYRFKNSFKAV